MRISTVQLQQNAVSVMLDRQSKLGKTQLEVASGKKFLSPADDPPGAVAALGYSSKLASLEQYQINADRASSTLALEDATLGAVSEHLQRVRELAVEAGNGTMGASGRLAISYEVRQLQQAVLDMANTRDAEGEYLFSGFQAQTQPYTDAGAGVFTYNGDQGQRMIQISPSTQMAASDAGARIFGALPANAGGFTDVFSIIYDFASDLESNTFDVGVIADLDTAMTRIGGARAVTGSRQNSLDAVKQLNETFAVDTKKNLSDVQDLDYTEAVSRLNLQLAGLQAAQEAYVRIQNLSLFNMLR